MASKQGRAIGGAFLGGLVGTGTGLWLGRLLGPVLAGVKQDDQSIFGFLDVCAGIFFSVVVGVICSIAGAVLGAAVATAPGKEPRPDGPAEAEQDPDKGPAAPQESTEAEVARLKAGFARLEERQRRDGTAEPREASPATDITTQQGPISATTGITSRVEPDKAEPSAPADRPRD
jgi:hypothetical protein